MSSKRRKKNSEITISLFSFQDIITCLSGIMILLVLLITVDIVVAKFDIVAPGSATPLNTPLPHQTGDSKLPIKEDDIQHLQTVVKEFGREMSEHQSRLKELKQQVTELEQQKKSLASRGKSISFIPAKDANPNQRPLLVECSGESIRGKFGSFSADSNGSRQFMQYLQTLPNLDKLRDYPLFIIKPSASDYAMQLVQQVQSMGFDVGYDAISENESIEITAEENSNR